MNELKISDKTDREQLALILVKHGYTVRIDKHKGTNGKAVYVVAYDELEQNEKD